MTDVVGKVSFKPQILWYIVKDEVSLGISHALNAIFNGLDHNAFKVINTCTSA